MDMQLIDTHCHIHDREFFSKDDAEQVYRRSAESLEAMLLVGTSLQDSKDAVVFASDHSSKCFVAVGIHPHEAGKLTPEQITDTIQQLREVADSAVVRAVGECGLDFYYNDRSEALIKQTQLLEGQLQIATDYKLPVTFHVREAFDDFWPILANFPDVTGVLHSFTDRANHVETALGRGLSIGVNGIATFTSHAWQKEIFKSIPIESIVLETDAPFLTPHPIRGTINEPRNVTYVTKYLAELRGEDEQYITEHTTANARRLFGF